MENPIILKFRQPVTEDAENSIGLTELDILGRILHVTDFIGGNVGFVLETSSKIDDQTDLSKLCPYIVDFRLTEYPDDYEKPICEDLLAGKYLSDKIMEAVLCNKDREEK